MRNGPRKYSDWFSKSVRNSIVGRAVQILDPREHRKLLIVSLLQIAMGFLDLFGIAVIGILGALAVVGVQSKMPGNRVSAALRLFHIESFSFQNQMAVLGLIAGVVLVTRTVFSVIFTRRIFFFLGSKGAEISADLVSKLLSRDLLEVQEQSAQQRIYSLTVGVNAIVMGIIASSITLISDLMLLIIITIGLIIVDIKIAISSFFLFGAIGLMLYRLMSVRAKKLGNENATLVIRSNQKISEVLNSYREAIVKNRRGYYAREIGNIRHQLAGAQSELSFMPYVSKYVIETAVVLGALLISASQFVLQDVGHAVGTLAVFLAAGSRIAPAVLRIQQGAIQIRGSAGTAEPTLKLISELKNVLTISNPVESLDRTHQGFSANVSLDNVIMFYPGSKSPSIAGVSLEVKENSVVAFVGSSGAGKTTLADLILGILKPASGSVKICGVSPQECTSKWPGAISYVPQEVNIIDGTIRENITLGFPSDEVGEELIKECLTKASLWGFVSGLPQGIETQVGDNGSRLSGGQRQRLGIARALLTNPKLLVLDEATSALDGETEAYVTEAIYKLKGNTTVIIIAHRLSTIKDADNVVFLKDGQIKAEGKFDEIRKIAPDFDHQAHLMGIKY